MPENIAPDTPTPTASEAEHPLAVGARSGIGPLSERAKEVWHGQSAPCASCAQLNRRDATHCAHCGQDLGQAMLSKMAKHSGSWFVCDTARPFPGVSLERIIHLINKSAIRPTSIVRGPTTYYQWRFAAETPLICKYLGRCWSCQSPVTAQRDDCPQCKVALDGNFKVEPPGQGRENAPVPNDGGNSPTPELAALSRAVRTSDPDLSPVRLAHNAERPLGKAPLIFLVIAVIVVALIVTLVSRDDEEAPSATPPASSTAELGDLTDPFVDDISRA